MIFCPRDLSRFSVEELEAMVRGLDRAERHYTIFLVALFALIFLGLAVAIYCRFAA